MIPAIKRSTLLDRHLGGAGGLMCMQQLSTPGLWRPGRPDELLARQAMRKAMLETPRQRTNYFNLPSLNLTKDTMGSGISSPRLQMRDGGSQTAREMGGRGGWQIEGTAGSGSQTARDGRKIAIAKESIMNSLKERLSQVGATPRSNVSGSQTAGHMV